MGCITFPSRHGEDGAGSMLTTDLYQLTIILVLLIALASWLILRGEAERAGRRFLLFLLGTGALLLLLVFLLFPGYDEPYNRFAFELPIMVMPALIAIFVLVLLYLRHFKGMDTRARVTAILMAFGLLTWIPAHRARTAATAAAYACAPFLSQSPDPAPGGRF
jgi:hypothetical protein